MKNKWKYSILLLVLVIISACSNEVSNKTSAERGLSPREAINKSVEKKELNQKEDTYNLDAKDVTHNENKYKANLDLFGRITIWEIEFKEQSEIKFITSAKNTKGDFKVVVTDNKNYIEYVENISNKNLNEHVKNISLNNGTYFVKLVGKDLTVKTLINLEYDSKKINVKVID